jgi:hypothetical protein
MFQTAHSKQLKPFSAKPVNDAGYGRRQLKINPENIFGADYPLPST